MKRLIFLGLLLVAVLVPFLAYRIGARTTAANSAFLPIVTADAAARRPTPTPARTTTPNPTAAPTSTAVPGPAETPVASAQCPQWVHDRYTAAGPDGKLYPTWHPPSDPEYGCWFGHEHGSDPRAFPAFAASGMPAFGYTAAQHGMSEPHVGFKVFVVDDHDRGLWWLITFHQGSSGAARAFVHMHTQDVIVARSSDQTILANVHLMAETGASQAKCRIPSDVIMPGSGPVAGDAGKALPTTDCTTDFYESWETRARIGAAFQFRGAFDIDNGVSALKLLPDGSYSQTEVVYSASLICPGSDPLDPNSDCNRIGDKRSLLNPRLMLNNTTGNGVIWTDPDGNPVATGQGIPQFVHPDERINQTASSAFANGRRGDDLMIYTALDYCNTDDCSPRSFTDGTVRPPN
jgi:hypothetical protein